MPVTRRVPTGAIAALALAATALPSLAQSPLRAGASPADPPWQNRKAEGSFEGFEVDIVNAIARRMGTTAQIEGYDFRALLVATASGRVDMVISSFSSLTITDARLDSQSFTQPHVRGATGIGLRAGSDITSLEGLRGRRIGTIATAFPERRTNERQGEIGFAANTTCDPVSNMLALPMTGRVDAVVNDVARLRHAVTRMQGPAVSHEIVAGERFAMTMPRNAPMPEQVNAIIRTLKEDGTMAAIYERRLGAPPPAGGLTETPMPVPTPGNC
jgi:polar amino acid transport system substrate-binding protein